MFKMTETKDVFGYEEELNSYAQICTIIGEKERFIRKARLELEPLYKKADALANQIKVKQSNEDALK